jgi:hypothetical protein
MERRTIVAIAAVLVVALAVAVGLRALSGDEPPSSGPTAVSQSPTDFTPAATATQTPAPATPTPSPSPTAEPTGPIQLAWEPATGLEPEASVADVAFIDERWIAVGSVSADAAIWTSDDGRAWERAVIDTTRTDDEVMAATDVSVLDSGIVAIGAFGAVATDQVAWVTWTSEDGGLTWSEHREGPTPHALRAVVYPGGALVGAGWDYAGTLPFDAWIAMSDDGVTWERLPKVFDDSEIHALGFVGDRIVAVGKSYAEDYDATAWFSDDPATAWSRVAVPDAGVPETMYDVIPVSDGVLAVGGGLEAGAAAWVTVDGETWRRFAIADGAEARAVTLLDDGAVAVGNAAGQDIGPALAWTSLDGQSWEAGREIGAGSVRMRTVASSGSVLVAGGECAAQECDAVLWVGEASR